MDLETDPEVDGRWHGAGFRYTVLYYDDRSVSRVYEMTFSDGVWRMRREAPGFWQRFEGTISQGGRTITARWEKSPDGSRWEHDFDVTYKRISSPG